jgi:hypothetical protein
LLITSLSLAVAVAVAQMEQMGQAVLVAVLVVSEPLHHKHLLYQHLSLWWLVQEGLE